MIPGLIKTSTTIPSLGDTTELTTAQVLIVSLTLQLSVAQQQRYDPNRQRQQPSDRGGDQSKTKGEKETNDNLKESLAPSIMMLIDNSLNRKTQIVLTRNSRTKTTATRMAMNVSMTMIVRIVCGQRRVTNRVQQQRIR